MNTSTHDVPSEDARAESVPVGGDLSSVAVPEDTFNKHINNLEVARVSCELEYPEDLGF